MWSRAMFQSRKSVWEKKIGVYYSLFASPRSRQRDAIIDLSSLFLCLILSLSFFYVLAFLCISIRIDIEAYTTRQQQQQEEQKKIHNKQRQQQQQQKYIVSVCRNTVTASTERP